MAEFFRTSTLWVIDFRYEGHPRRWFRTFPAGVDVTTTMQHELRQLYEGRATLVEARRASDAEERQYLRDELPSNVYCPTGRR